MKHNIKILVDDNDVNFTILVPNLMQELNIELSERLKTQTKVAVEIWLNEQLRLYLIKICKIVCECQTKFNRNKLEELKEQIKLLEQEVAPISIEFTKLPLDSEQLK